MIENINITGHEVSAALHALMNDSVYGYNGVFNYGEKLACEIVSNNEIRIKDGLLLNQGRFMSIKTSTYESLAIENGVSGVNRTDLIVAHFETDGITETHELRIIKGAAGGSEPTHTTGNTFTGARVNELPLYAVKLEGLNIVSVEQKFTLIDSLKNKGNILYGTTTPSNVEGTDGDIYIMIE